MTYPNINISVLPVKPLVVGGKTHRLLQDEKKSSFVHLADGGGGTAH